jgi:ABC-type antimicrobial peptide transport system permease subunit
VRQRNLEEAPAMTIYRPYSQIVEHDMFLLVRARSAQDDARIAASLRQHLMSMNAAHPWSEVRRMHDVIDGSESIRIRRFVQILLASFAGLALLLAGVGTYGVMAYAVAERTREIGVRVALGATRPLILRDVLGETLRLTIAGLILGAIAAQASMRFIATLLYDVRVTDVVTWLIVSLLIAIVALLAAIVPARRALQIDPLVALRQEQ